MKTFESVLHVLLVMDALAMVALIMLQQGKGADVGAAFGSGASNTMFGGAGSASFLTKVTVWLAIGFFAISFGLAYSAQQRADNLLDIDIPTARAVEKASDPATGPAADSAAELTPDAKGVDSDIPEI